MPGCPDMLKHLIDRFTQQADQIRSPDYNETLIRIDFINPLMGLLGWDIDNRQGFAEQYREVVHEDRVRVAGQTKAPDYSFRIGGLRKFFLEAKKPSVDIKVNWEPAYQLRRYAWSARLACSLLTDFEEFAIYDTLTPSLAVDDRTLKTMLSALYYPQSPYEFTMVSADILGSVYERFLGKVISLTPAHNTRIEEKPEVRKAGGVYYTPTYIVD